MASSSNAEPQEPRAYPPGSSVVSLMPDDQPTVITRSSATTPLANPGQLLGPYTLHEAVGRGGMATVFRASDNELGRTVALKILPPETMHDQDSVNRFKQEARAAAKLDHGNIARIYTCGEDRGLHYIAFEFVPGENLREVIARGGPLPPEAAFDYLMQITRGLQHASERGVTHRDIKPSNILITPDGTAKIVDMGLARSADVVGHVTHSGVTLGTFDYISPEQALDPRRADIRSDIYSLGCTFYHALTGHPPVPDGTAARKLQAHQQDRPIDPRDYNPKVPEALVTVLARMMAKDPQRRPQTATALLIELQQAAMSCGFAAETPVSGGSRIQPALPRQAWQLPVPWLIAACAAVVAVAVMLGRPEPKGTVAPPWENVNPKPVTPDIAVGPAVADPKTIGSAPQLIEALKSGESLSLRLKPGTIYDLAALGETAVFAGTSLTLEADAAGGSPPVIRLNAAPAEETPVRPGSLQWPNLRNLTLRGLEIRVAEPNAVSTQPLIALAVHNAAKVHLFGCVFRLDHGAVASGLTGLDLGTENTAELTMKYCLWNFGVQNTACVLRGALKAEIEDCAFAPHDAAMFFPASARNGPELTIADSTFMIDRGAAFRAEGPAAIQAGCTLFAATEVTEGVMPGMTPRYGGTVLKLEEESPAKFASRPQMPNAYFGVTPVMRDDKAGGFNESNETFSDATARVLTAVPWTSNDPRLMLSGSDAAAAFRLNLAEPRLRVAAEGGIVGVKQLGAHLSKLYNGALTPVLVAGKAERIVWPDAEPEEGAKRIYPSFAAAFNAVQVNETIVLAVNGPVPVPLLAERSLKLTVRAADGYSPVLMPEGAGFTVDAAMFRLAEGSLAFENLEIQLKGRQCVAVAPGRSGVSFRHCQITLHGKDEAVAAVVIPDAAREMKAAGAEEPPRVLFQDTIIRGSGRAVWVQAARNAAVSVENSAVALDGSLLYVEATERAGAMEAPRVNLKLNQSTLILDDAVLELQGGRATAVIDAMSCLFAPADSRSTASLLVLLNDVDPQADLIKSLDWSGRGCVFAYPDSAAVEWRAGGETTSWDWPHWLRYARDDGQQIGKLKLLRGNMKSKLLTAQAADFATAGNINAGADISKLPGSK